MKLNYSKSLLLFGTFNVFFGKLHQISARGVRATVSDATDPCPGLPAFVGLIGTTNGAPNWFWWNFIISDVDANSTLVFSVYRLQKQQEGGLVGTTNHLLNISPWQEDARGIGAEVGLSLVMVTTDRSKMLHSRFSAVTSKDFKRRC